MTFPDPRGSFAVANNNVFFSADDGVSGLELWKTDGTPTGTVRVKDIKPGAVSSNPYALTAVGNKLFFGAPSGNNKGIGIVGERWHYCRNVFSEGHLSGK